MENSDANHLPEVDSLPDGFFESSAEPLGPATPVLGQEKTKPDHNEDNDLKNDSEPEPSITQGKSEPKSEKIHKMRNFPVILTEKDNSDSSGPSPKVPSDGCLGDTNDSLSGASTRVKNELPSKFSNEKGKVEVKHENSEKSITGDLESQGVKPKGISSSDSTEASKNRKAGASEVKCKTAKHGFKSEKEFLEFTLKYQKVIAEKDSAIAVRDRLESLCRELQRQNKMLMEECKRVSTEGKDLRYDLSTKFHEAIKDVNSRLEEQKNESLSQFKENEM